MSPPTRLTHFSPIFSVKDLHRALAHYDSLGFTTHPYADGDEYGFADRDGIGLHLAAEPGKRLWENYPSGRRELRPGGGRMFGLRRSGSFPSGANDPGFGASETYL